MYNIIRIHLILINMLKQCRKLPLLCRKLKKMQNALRLGTFSAKSILGRMLGYEDDQSNIPTSSKALKHYPNPNQHIQ